MRLACAILVGIASVGCGPTSEKGQVPRKAVDPSTAAAAHAVFLNRFVSASSVELHSLSAAMTEAQWQSEMRALEGKDVAAVGCAYGDGSTGGVSFLVMPCVFESAKDDVTLKASEAPQRLVVSLRVPIAGRVPAGPVRVVGRLKIGTVRRDTWLVAWGSVEDAEWESIDR